MTDLTLDTQEGREGQAYVPRNFPSVLADAKWCGASFNRGLLRIHDAVSGPDSAEDIVKAFSGDVSPSADVIAFDWAGRQFVVDEKRGAQGQQLSVLAADPATGDIEEIADVDEFLFLLQVPEVTAVLQQERDHDGNTSLHHVVWRASPQYARPGRPAIDDARAAVRLLLAAGAHPLDAADDGSTPLAIATDFDLHAVVEELER